MRKVSAPPPPPPMRSETRSMSLMRARALSTLGKLACVSEGARRGKQLSEIEACAMVC